MAKHEQEQEAKLLRGRLRGEGEVVGSVAPLQLDVNGRIFGRDLVVNGRPLGDIRAAIDGVISKDWVKLHTQRLKLLGGDWNIDARWPSDFPRKALELDVAINALSLQEVGQLMRTKELSGTAAATLAFKIPGLDRSRLQVSGKLSVNDARFRAASQELLAQSLTARIDVRNGLARIDPIEIKQESGQITATAEFALATPMLWQINAAAQQWPLDLAELDSSLKITGQTNVAIDFSQRSATGPLRGSAEVITREKPLGTAQLAADFDGRVARVRQLSGDVFGGTFAGSATIDADALLRTVAHVDFKNIDTVQLAAFVPRLDNTTGKISGVLEVAPADDPRLARAARNRIACPQRRCVVSRGRVSPGGYRRVHESGSGGG